MSRGKLVQHVTNHGVQHEIEFEDGEVLNITSTHHQMCYPFDLPREDYSLIAWSKDKRSTTYLNGNNSEKELPNDFREPEIIFYYNTNCLGIQGHPEYMDQEIHKKLITKLNKLINDCKNYSLEGVK